MIVSGITIGGSVVVLLFAGLTIILLAIVSTAIRLQRGERDEDFDNWVRLDAEERRCRDSCRGRGRPPAEYDGYDDD